MAIEVDTIGTMDTLNARTRTPRASAPPSPDACVAAAHVVADRAIDAQRRSAIDDAQTAYPTALLDALRDNGLLAAPLAPALGGAALGLAPGTVLALLRTLGAIGRADLSAGRLYEGHVDALLLVARYGTLAQQARVARRVHAGAMFGVWNTEPPGRGVHVTPNADGRLRLTGRKSFASGAGHLGGAVVTGALPDGGWQMSLVPMRALARVGQVAIDTSAWHPLGMHGSESHAIDFLDARLPAWSTLGAPGDYYRQPRFTGGAIRFASVQLGGAERLLDETRRFLHAAGRVDDPYQLARIGEATTLVAGAKALLRDAADVAEHEANVATVLVYANMARTAVADTCVRVSELAQRSVGARGLLEPEPFAGIVRDLLMYLRQPAPDAALADVGRFALVTPTPIGRQLWDAATMP